MKGTGAIFEKTLSTGYNNKGQASTMAGSTGGMGDASKIPDMTANEKLANEATLRGEIHSMEVSCSSTAGKSQENGSGDTQGQAREYHLETGGQESHAQELRWLEEG